MARHDDRIDACVEALKRVDDADLASLSHTPAAQALYEEVVSMKKDSMSRGESAAPPAGKSRRRRLVWQGAAVVGAAAIVLAVLSIVNVFGASGPSIVEKAVAALDPSENAILHLKITGHESYSDGSSATWTEESWSRSSAPYTWRLIQADERSAVTETLQDDSGFAQVYDAATDTIYQPPPSGVFRVVGDPAAPYREAILEMLNSGQAVVEGSETIDGRECLRIAATKDYGTAADGMRYGTWYLVDAGTKNPVEWRMTRDGGKVVTFRFDIYEQLPATEDNLALLDLAVQHPGAAFSTSLEDYQKAMGIPQAEPGSGPVKGEGHASDVEKGKELGRYPAPTD